MGPVVTSAPSTPTLARDPAVVELQLLLATRGYSPGPIDGIRGTKTDRAIGLANARAGGGGPPVVEWLRGQPSAHVQVPRVTTPLASVDVKLALMVGHFAVFDVYPSSNRLRMARAQMGVEHGLDGHAIHTFNLGNVMTGTGYAGAWFAMTADEEQLVDKHRRTLARQGVRVARRSTWRAPATPEEGGAIYWGMMREHFAAALKTFDSGNPAAAARALKTAGYYTAHEADYERLLEAGWRAVGW